MPLIRLGYSPTKAPYLLTGYKMFVSLRLCLFQHFTERDLEFNYVYLKVLASAPLLKARSQNCEKRLLALCLSVRPHGTT